MGVLNSFVEDMFQKLQSEAVNIAKINNTKTLSAREIQTAARLLLPPELAKHAMSEGTKAVAKYNAAANKDGQN
jgi:histone H2B